MPPHDLARDGRFLGSLSRLRARTALAELLGPERRDELEEINWNVDARAITRASVALHGQVRQAATDGSLDEEGSDARRAALVDARGWEALASVESPRASFSALVNSAVAYELAGYQANAVCLARAAERRVRNGHATLSRAAATFLQRQFLRLAPMARDIAEAGLSENFIADALGDTAQPLTDDDLAYAAAEIFAVTSLSHAASYFLSGDESHVDEAVELLEIASKGFALAGSVRETNLVSNLRALLPIMKRRATWSTLGHVFEDDPRWSRYLRVLARGTGSILRDSRSISELWPSQATAVREGIVSDRDAKVLRMPTSAGKTRVAELAIVHSLLTFEGSRCLYIAPYRALAAEVETSLDTVLGELGFGATSLIGGPEAIGIEETLATENPVIVLTPEKADLLLRVRPDLIDEVRLVVLDEGHVVGDERRGARFELLVSRLRQRLPEARFVFLSAVVPEETLTDFAAWLGAPAEHGIIRSPWRPAVQRVSTFEWTAKGGTLRYRRSSEGSVDLTAFESFLPRLIPERQFVFINPETGRRNTRRFPDATNRSQLVAALALEFSNTGPVLMFCPQTNLVESCAKALKFRLDLASLTDEPLPPWFTRRRYPSAEVAAEWLGEDSTVTELLRFGIGVHHGRLPDAVRRSIEDDFRDGRLRVLAATNTLGQGVNLPVRTVLVHSVRRRDDEGRETRLSARDYWNIAGRAGRAGFETDGLIVHLTVQPRDHEDLRYFLDRAENVEPVQSTLYRILNALVTERISSDQAFAELDPSVMALLIEEGGDNVGSMIQAVEPLLRRSLVGVQATRQARSIDPLVEVAEAGANAIVQKYSFADLQVFARTGLASASCAHLRDDVTARRSLVGAMLVDGAAIPEFLPVILDALAAIDEMQPEREFAGSYEDLVAAWISGLSVPDIARGLDVSDEGPVDVAVVARAIEEAASYLLPWGISAYLQIAEALLGVSPVPAVSALPGLVKYGVPDAVSAWMMAFGITSRTVAMRLSRRYSGEGGDAEPAELRAWLAMQDAQSLAQSVGARGIHLEEVGAMVTRARRPLLAAALRQASLLPRAGHVVLAEDAPALIAASGIVTGEHLNLLRDYESALDRSSVVVVRDRVPIGRLDVQSASLLAVDMDAGLDVHAVVTDIDSVDTTRVNVTLTRRSSAESG